MQNLPQAKTNN